jgi:hypothetical protein
MSVRSDGARLRDMGRESRSVQSRGTSGLSLTGASTMPSSPRLLRRRCVRMRRIRRRRTGSRLVALNSILRIRGMRSGQARQGARHTGRRNDGSRSAADARPWMFIGKGRVRRRGANELLCPCIDRCEGATPGPNARRLRVALRLATGRLTRCFVAPRPRGI